MAKLRDLVGKMKDKASQSKAAFLSNPTSLRLHLHLLRATTHDPSSPPKPKHLDALLSHGDSSRATASATVAAVMDRLHGTSDSSVAIKCLFAIHHIVRRGGFILQDQLSVYPTAGGRNYLNLSTFRDDATPFSWEFSRWVRFYARYLENLISTSRVLGYFICSSSGVAEKEREEESLSGMTNFDLIREMESLVGLTEETCRIPDSVHVSSNPILRMVRGFVVEECLSCIEAVSIRVNEFAERLTCLSFGDSVELVCAIKRLEGCKERLGSLNAKTTLFEVFWCSVADLRDKVGGGGGGGGGRKMEAEERAARRVGGTESARFGGRVIVTGNDSVKFSSGRVLGLTKMVPPVAESPEPYSSWQQAGYFH